MSIRQTSPLVARTLLLGRHGWKRAARIAHERFTDIVLLLVAVAIALVIRGVPRHQVIGGLEDAGWAALAVALYLPIVFVAGAIATARRLGRWRISHTPIAGGVILRLEWTPNGLIPAAGGRCVVHCADGSRHAAEAPLNYGTIYVVYNATFPSTGVYPPHGDHVAHWYVKEQPRDGWIKVAEDPFTYDPLAQPAA